MSKEGNPWFVRCRRELRLAADRLIDWRWGIDTLSGTWTLPEKAGRFEDAAKNIPISYYLLFRFLGRTVFEPSDVFYDIGCGNGRVLCYAARKHISKAIGIELSPGFADKAHTNAQKLRNRRSAIEVRCGDAVEMDFSDGTVFFFYNPFGPKTLELVLATIRKTIGSHNRAMRFFYQNPVHSSFFWASGWLKHAGTKKDIFSGQQMELWTYAS